MNETRLFIKNVAGRVFDVWDDAMDRLQSRPQPRLSNIQLRDLTATACGSGDGRWFLCDRDLTTASIVYSVGVGFDISFDLDLIRRYGCQVHTFDPTPRSQDWLAAQPDLPAALVHHDVGLANYSGTANFKLPANHSVSFSMSERVTADATQQHVSDVKTLPALMQELGHQQIDVLKIDIEGAEYDIIDDLVAHAGNVHQLLIEFHDRMVGATDSLPSRDAIKKLRQAGYRMFNVSRRGFEYTFVGPNF